MIECVPDNAVLFEQQEAEQERKQSRVWNIFITIRH